MPHRFPRIAALALCAATAMVSAAACGGASDSRVLTMSGSLVGREGEVIRRQLERFRQAHPGIAVQLRPTPDAADQRHQLYVQWLNARVSEPDVLQLDVVWTPEFAAAGWIAPIDGFHPPVDDLFAATVAANRWNGALYALPWFVDVGMLYWRTDLLAEAPRDLDALMRMAKDVQTARGATGDRGVPFGFVWQGARYEGLVTVFLEHLGAFGGAILDEAGRVVVDSDASVRALTFMRDAIYEQGVVPQAVLTWQEEQTRFAFQNGQAVFMRNWPYAYALLEDASESRVAGVVAVAPMPGAPGGAPTAALGGSTLAINAYSDQPDDAYRLIDFLLQPEQMLERAAVAGQFPPRQALYDTPELAGALDIPPSEARRIIEAAVPRPVSPVYSQLSEILQVSLHRALTRQQDPRPALEEAASAMRMLLARLELSPS
ncbi:MAG TPA: ABC transporter substrate-binding protein [Vicinamibacterales bacterium]|nr:ABC transporter substrate-binding protein [Vicinamibacterales bacterium]